MGIEAGTQGIHTLWASSVSFREISKGTRNVNRPSFSEVFLCRLTNAHIVESVDANQHTFSRAWSGQRKLRCVRQGATEYDSARLARSSSQTSGAQRTAHKLPSGTGPFEWLSRRGSPSFFQGFRGDRATARQGQTIKSPWVEGIYLLT